MEHVLKFPADAPVTQAKLDQLRASIAALGMDLGQVQTRYIRASGPGGQKVNKTSSGVWLKYLPDGIQVKWTRGRSRALNRFLALRELVDEIEAARDPAGSRRIQEQERQRKQKKRRQRRSAGKKS